ncbi:hypothetical protein B0H10DRAFT_2209752 [Mycena sp. CBHHK59/15]|nr:hypothetical protein B0H10DRAFT_2209752 [Mycena sp. CBHHK59/15]
MQGYFFNLYNTLRLYFMSMMFPPHMGHVSAGYYRALARRHPAFAQFLAHSVTTAIAGRGASRCIPLMVLYAVPRFPGLPACGGSANMPAIWAYHAMPPLAIHAPRQLILLDDADTRLCDSRYSMSGHILERENDCEHPHEQETLLTGPRTGGSGRSSDAEL